MKNNKFQLSQKKDTLVISFISYNQETFQYLKALSQSLDESIQHFKKRFPFFKIFFMVKDNSRENFSANRDFLEKWFQEKNYQYQIWTEGGNLGFARAYNLMMAEAWKREFSLFLMINPDIFLENNFLEEIIRACYDYPEASVLAPKIMFWDFPKYQAGDFLASKTNIIDSCGLSLSPTHRFFDRGQGRIDLGYWDEVEEIFGFTGAGALLKLKELGDLLNLEDRQVNLEFFDQLMFMYKEDVDLSYRLQLVSKKIFFIPEARIYHHRTLSSANSRFFKKIFTRKNKANNWSFLHQLIILYKIKKLPFSFYVKNRTKVRHFFLMTYGFLFKNSILRDFFKIKGKINKKIFTTNASLEGIQNLESFMKKK